MNFTLRLLSAKFFLTSHLIVFDQTRWLRFCRDWSIHTSRMSSEYAPTHPSRCATFNQNMRKYVKQLASNV